MNVNVDLGRFQTGPVGRISHDSVVIGSSMDKPRTVYACAINKKMQSCPIYTMGAEGPISFARGRAEITGSITLGEEAIFLSSLKDVYLGVVRDGNLVVRVDDLYFRNKEFEDGSLYLEPYISYEFIGGSLKLIEDLRQAFEDEEPLCRVYTPIDLSGLKREVLEMSYEE